MPAGPQASEPATGARCHVMPRETDGPLFVQGDAYVTQTTGHTTTTVRGTVTRTPLPRAVRRPELLVSAVAATIFLWRVGSASAWWDEAITRDVVSRSTGDILALTGTIDLVHATYYLLAHGLFGTDASITTIRLLSVAAAALTAALLVRIGRELGSLPVGIAAGMLWAVAPLASRYAQEARPYALVACAVTAATLALLQVCRKPWRQRRWVAYGAALVAVGLLNVLALLIVVVHLVHVAATTSRAVRRRWYAAVTASGVLLSPLVVGGALQREQVSWLPRPDSGQLLGFLDAQYTVGPVVVLLLVLATVGLGRGTHAQALGLGLSWALLPPVLLWSVSQVHPLYDWRYVFFAVPGTALALASLAPLLRPLWTTVLVVALAVTGFHMQQVYRWPATGHAEDIRGTAQVIGDGARPGDAVVFLPASRRVVALGYPDEFAAVDDVALARDPVSSATLWGVESSPREMAAALRDRSRVWVVTGPRRYGEGEEPVEREKQRLLASEFRLAEVVEKARFEVRLYVRAQPHLVPSLPGEDD